MPCLRSAWLKEVSALPYLVTGRVTSWLDSTQVGGAPSGMCVARVRSIDPRSAAASQLHARKSKLKAVCISSGRRYRANRSWSGSHTSPIRMRSSYSSATRRQPR